eukprot:5560053-Amphidinium_carterae.1
MVGPQLPEHRAWTSRGHLWCVSLMFMRRRSVRKTDMIHHICVGHFKRDHYGDRLLLASLCADGGDALGFA